MKVKFSILSFAVLLFPIHSWTQNAAGATQAFGSNAQSSGLEGKFSYYVNETYLNPSVFTAPAFRAGIRMANPPGTGVTQYPPEWRQGAEAFGRNYGDAFAQRVCAANLPRLPRKAQPPRQRPTTGTQTPEQHITLLAHGWLLCKHDAAWAGMGATTEVTRGKAIAAAKPILRTATRRERYSIGTFGSTSRLAFANCSSASRTTDSSTRADSCLESVLVICDGLLLPSQSFQMAAAVEFKQWPTSRCKS